ncbi:sulfotransferase [Sphingobium sp.]|uniref:sulfotransferase n=1 Tax=Sphingobium sp. TaxID=1912891 RepID=UPI002BD94C57|nr:sulfotransferase [Sphingobium sp.]HUD92486.1 sulfotransferase [Sphingobium sp.]
MGAIVHIGYHKTGTTWFQHVFYPAVRNRNYLPRRTTRAAFLAPGALHFDPAEARHILGQDRNRAILCEENLTGGLHNGGLAGALSKDVAHRLHAALPDADIVIFVRDPVSAIGAAWLQYVKGGGTFGLNRYLFGRDRLSPVAPERDEAPGFRLEHFDYHRLIAHYDMLFGPDSVHVFRYEDFRTDPRGFASAFAARFGLEIDLSQLDFDTRNPSLSRSLLWLARGMNLFTRRAVADKSWLIHIPGWYRLSRRLLRRANASGRFGRSLRTDDLMDGRLAARLRAHYAPSEAMLAARLRWQTQSDRSGTVVRWRQRH